MLNVTRSCFLHLWKSECVEWRGVRPEYRNVTTENYLPLESLVNKKILKKLS